MTELMIDALRSVHLIGLALGFGLALYADLQAFRTVLHPVTPADLERLHNLHTIILVGLGVLWASGLGLLYMRTGFDLSAFAPKLFIKLGVVTLLTCNALIIGAVAMPMFARNLGARFGELDLKARLGLSLVAGLSGACWFSGLALGAFTQMRDLAFAPALMIIAALFAASLTAALTLALLAPRFAPGAMAGRGSPSYRRQMFMDLKNA